MTFEELEKICARPKPFDFYTAKDLWTGDHVSKMMLSFHLNDDVDISSYNKRSIDRSVEWIASHFNVGPGTKIADFGCGPGLYATRLARKHAAVTGIDFSARSIQHARKAASSEGLSIRYIHQDYLEVQIDDRFRLILMIMCDLCALSPGQRKTMLSKFHSLLESGGAVLLDVYSLAAFDQRQETTKFEVDLLDGFWSPDRYFGFLNTFKYEKEKVVLDKFTVVEPAGVRTIYNWLQYFSADALRQEFVDSGFAVEQLYSDVAGSPLTPGSSEFAVIARKP
jgi:cyclopropane fatty-acyl-phospholipid synthase-like methyltransferase